MSIVINLQVQFYTYANGNKTKIFFYNSKGEKMLSKTYDMSIVINLRSSFTHMTMAIKL